MTDSQNALKAQKTMKDDLEAKLLFGSRESEDYGLQPVAMVINIFITQVYCIYAHSNLNGIDPPDSHVVNVKNKNSEL